MQITHNNMANAIRALSMDAVEKANSGHPGMPLGMADVATVLHRDFLKFKPQDPDWFDRDRLILSAGHGSMLLYALLFLNGYEDLTLDEIKNFRQLGAKTPGHPEYGHAKGIETTTGPLGQGLANAVGFAIAEEMLKNRLGAEIINHYTYVIAGDGCLMEGISHEAISLAGHLKLNKLIVLFDDNGISIDGPTSLSVSDNQLQRFAASNWNVVQINGHNPAEIRDAIAHAQNSNKPSFIACKTTIAYGAPTKAGTSDSHGSPLGKTEIEGTRKNLDWPHEPFVIPSNILSAWRGLSNRNDEAYKLWHENVKHANIAGVLADLKDKKYLDKVAKIIDQAKKQYVELKPNWATRKSSGDVLEYLTAQIGELVGGSADLTGSNLTKTKNTKPINASDFSGNYIYYGVREHAMAAAMNGIALHGGFVPYGGTFLVFTDYCKPAIRLSALMKQQVIYVMTHDSIGLGEDGPTHQPIEHLAALRAVPNLYVMRPADAIETAECWQAALELKESPSILALSRQNLPLIRDKYEEQNLCQKGAYIISEAKDNKPQFTIFASGSEVVIALDAQKKLQENGDISVRVVSVPCWELFESQDLEYQMSILCNDSVKIAVEAACSFGWERFIGAHGIFVGLDSFGASAPAADLYKYFGITVDNIVRIVQEKLANRVLYDAKCGN